MTMTKFSRINKQREEITMRVLEDMEKGGNEWKKPWVEASPLPPHNPVSGTQYSGRKKREVRLGAGFSLFAFVVTDMNTWYNSTSCKT